MAIVCNLLIGLIADVVPESYQILGGNRLMGCTVCCRWCMVGIKEKPHSEMTFSFKKNIHLTWDLVPQKRFFLCHKHIFLCHKHLEQAVRKQSRRLCNCPVRKWYAPEHKIWNLKVPNTNILFQGIFRSMLVFVGVGTSFWKLEADVAKPQSSLKFETTRKDLAHGTMLYATVACFLGEARNRMNRQSLKDVTSIYSLVLELMHGTEPWHCRGDHFATVKTLSNRDALFVCNRFIGCPKLRLYKWSISWN